jgi:hypothetical protein
MTAAPIEITTETEAIIAAALDYAHSAYEVDSLRMEKALHPHLAKRIVVIDAATGKSRLSQMTALELVQYARSGAGQQPENQRQADVTVLDVFGNTASVRLEMNDWIDYMHLAKYNEQWVIINVLWALKSQS